MTETGPRNKSKERQKMVSSICYFGLKKKELKRSKWREGLALSSKARSYSKINHKTFSHQFLTSRDRNWISKGTRKATKNDFSISYPELNKGHRR